MKRDGRDGKWYLNDKSFYVQSSNSKLMTIIRIKLTFITWWINPRIVFLYMFLILQCKFIKY